MVIMSLLIVAIAGALIVSLKTTGSTEQRLHESQDVLITSSYVANDVQSAASVDVNNATTDCSGALTTLVQVTTVVPTFRIYRGVDNMIDNTQTRTRACVGAYVTGTARPNHELTPDSSTPMSVTMTFTKPSDCTSIATRSSAPPAQPGLRDNRGNPLPSDVVLSTGAEPLWVQGAADPARRPAASSIRPRRLCRSPTWRRPIGHRPRCGHH
jgi:hypothetical protein